MTKSKPTQRVSFPKGQTVMVQGDIGNVAYLIVEGELDVIVENEKGERVRIATMNPGDICGELALMTGTNRTATVKAAKDSILMPLSHEDLGASIIRQGSLLHKITSSLSHRIQQTNEFLFAGKKEKKETAPQPVPKAAAAPAKPLSDEDDGWFDDPPQRF